MYIIILITREKIFNNYVVNRLNNLFALEFTTSTIFLYNLCQLIDRHLFQEMFNLKYIRGRFTTVYFGGTVADEIWENNLVFDFGRDFWNRKDGFTSFLC